MLGTTFMGPAVIAEEHPNPTADLLSLIAAQEKAGVYEHSLWIKRGHKNRDVHSGRLERTYVSRLETELNK
ncbi:hypothetical protein SKAU_G00061860 [Synaphobranchus kaupii]|uniref:Uncharacterized protein n=1 Tax=Synaphobranchus kaupii TaxID=118154 RepID=A0A9Q1G5Z2_SYNKA|nr:hypothetical protein SKAU_G00061860 [Synaphobranchus kaupii]